MAIRKQRKMSEGDIENVVMELRRWESGSLGSKLTWKRLEEAFGFSRVSLSGKPKIMAAYQRAKDALSGGILKGREQQIDLLNQLQEENVRLSSELEEYKRRESNWLKRWQRIAYHVRLKGVSIREADREAPQNAKLPTQKETSKVLREFDKPMLSRDRK